jgi:16S rRNA (cytidine1402-2'-O)-methyltransferase
VAATLYLVATPIGNLEDITLRALRILREEVNVIACEDTRQTQKLLTHYEIRKPLISYHGHNEVVRASEIMERMSRGESVALVSDAGTPLISDPGYRVVAEAVAKGYSVVPIPGASALLAAVTASGLSGGEFRFLGFLPAKSAARRRMLEELTRSAVTVVAYESPHRILDSLSNMHEILGDRQIVLARELTKVHEEFLRGTPDEIRRLLLERDSIKGEITIVIAPSTEKNRIGDPLSEVYRLEHEEGLERMEAIKAVAKRLGLPKRQVYRLAAERDSSRRNKDHG